MSTKPLAGSIKKTCDLFRLLAAKPFEPRAWLLVTTGWLGREWFAHADGWNTILKHGRKGAE